MLDHALIFDREEKKRLGGHKCNAHCRPSSNIQYKDARNFSLWFKVVEQAGTRTLESREDWTIIN
jgi:hypothetical protein